MFKGDKMQTVFMRDLKLSGSSQALILQKSDI